MKIHQYHNNAKYCSLFEHVRYWKIIGDLVKKVSMLRSVVNFINVTLSLECVYWEVIMKLSVCLALVTDTKKRLFGLYLQTLLSTFIKSGSLHVTN